MKKWLKRFLYFIGGLLLLVILLLLFLQTGMAKKIIRDKVQAYVSKKTNSQFTIGQVDYRLPQWLELRQVLWLDQRRDTLLFGDRVYVNIKMLKLISGNVDVNAVELENIFINLTQKQTDSVFNYQFIADAFTSKDTVAVQEKDTAGMQLSVKQMALKNVRFNMLDDRAGSYLRLSVASLDVKMNAIDLTKQVYDVKKLYTDQLVFDMRTTKTATAKADTAVVKAAAFIMPVIKADDINISNAKIYFEDKPTQLLTDNKIGSLTAKGISNKDNVNIFKGSTVALKNSDILFQHAMETTTTDETNTDTIKVSNSMAFVIDEIDLANNNIVYNNLSKPALQKGLDYYHLNIKGLTLYAKNTSLNGSNIATDIERFAFADKSGFRIDSLKGKVKMDSQHISVKDLVLITPSTQIRMSAYLSPASFTTPAKPGEPLPNNRIVLSQTIVGRKDLDLLANGLTDPYKQQLDELGNLVVDADIEGTSADMLIRTLRVNATTANTLSLQMSGRVKNLADTNRIQYDVNIQRFTASRRLINPFVNKPGAAQQISLPPMIALQGKLKGDMRNITADIASNTAYGYASVKGSILGFSNPDKMGYNVTVNTKEFETGKWIGRDSMLGKLTGRISVKGNNGFDVATNNLDADVAISSFRLNKDVLNNINMKASMRRGDVQAVASIKDEMAQLNLNGRANIAGKYPTADVLLDIQKADLLALGFAKDTLNVSALTVVKVNNASPQNLDAFIRIDTAVITKDKQVLKIDSATINAFVRNDSTILQVRTPFADANATTSLYYDQVPLLLNEVMARYLPMPDSLNKQAPKGSLAADIVVKPNQAYTAFVPNLAMPDAITIQAKMANNTDSALHVKAAIPWLRMNDLRVGNMQADITGMDSLALNVTVDTLTQGSIVLYDASVKGGFDNNHANVTVSTKDEQKKEQFRVAAKADLTDKNDYKISLGNDLKLNYADWQVNNSNVIHLRNDGFIIRNFEIQRDNQKVAVNHQQESVTAPLQVNIDDFRISTITGIFDKDSLQMDGRLNVDLTITDMKQAIPNMDGKIDLDSLTYQKMFIGNLDATAKSEGGNVTLNGKIEGNGNNVTLTGNYNASTIDAKINLDPIALSSIEPFTMGNLKRSKGTISGPINITGSAADPRWNGELTFNGVQTTLSQFGTVLKIDGQKINFNYPTITLNNFTVQDSLNNNLRVDGTITQTEKNLDINLGINTRNFLAVSNTSADNNIIYGKAIVDVNTTIKGPVNAPEINGSIGVKNGTDVTFVRETVPPSIKDRDNVMEFVDMDTINNLLVKRTLVEEVAAQKKASGEAFALNYNLDLNIQEEAKFTVVVDPITGDELQVQGKAQLNAGVNPDGSISLTGRYDLDKGSYQLNYQFLKRKFVLQDNSSVTLSGDPMDAYADITAVYEIEAAPIDLIGNEVSATTEAENFQAKVPFEVLLKIKGPVSAPKLSFDIRIKENATGVDYTTASTIENKLDQLRGDTSAINKQVFALLIMNRFIGEQSRDFFAGNNSNSSSILANSSVSAFLGEALNNLASDLISGVDIDINLKNVDNGYDEQHTDLSVGLSKRFMDDRLSVTVGKSFAVEGNDPAAASRNGSNSNVQFIPDVSTTYKLSKDGRYMIRAYRRNQYEAILDGYFIETGVAFTLSMDYNKFKEIFRKRKRRDDKERGNQPSTGNVTRKGQQ